MEIVKVEVSEEFLPFGSPELDDEILDWDSVSLFPILEDRIDLSELVRQNILAAYPYKPLCRPDCPGIDYDRDAEEEETSSEGEVDPRLLPLLQIQQKAEGK